MSDENIKQTAKKYVSSLQVLAGIMGFEKAYGLIVGSLMNDDTYTWDQKRFFFDFLREEWIDTYDSELVGNLNDFIYQREEAVPSNREVEIGRHS